MTGLPAAVRDAVAAVLARHPQVSRAILFGSRAKGTNEPASDIDLALEGDVTAFEAASIAQELADLPTPYAFDVQSLAAISPPPCASTSPGWGRWCTSGGRRRRTWGSGADLRLDVLTAVPPVG